VGVGRGGLVVLAGLLGAGGLIVALPAAVRAAAAPPSGQSGAPVRVVIQSPQGGERVRNKVHQAPIRGTALAEGEAPLAYDVILVLDVSGSTELPSGADVDGDGELGFDPSRELVEPGTYPEGLKCTDPGDSVFAAELAAARALLASLEPGRVRLGVVTFSGEMNPLTGQRAAWDQQDAWLEVPLTSDFGAVERALAAIAGRGPFGATNFAAGLRLAIAELAGLGGAKSEPRESARKVVLFLTDGTPTFPIGLGSVSDPGDTEAALTAARLAHKAGIAVNTYAIGSQALTEPFAATEIARITLGTFLPVRNPGDIVSFLQAVSFANVDDVVFSNLTTREVSTDVRLAPDGTFSGFVPVREGTNRIRVTALASNGSSGSVDFDLEFETTGLTGRELLLELDRIRNRNKELMLLIERDRIQSFRQQQRKELDLEVEPPPQ
jgi:Mg-chelatase subunit ChlD